MATGIRDYYAARKGTSNGIPVLHVLVNIERDLSWQGQTDTFLPARGVRICGNDYTATTTKTIRNLFAPPGGTNGPDPRPVLVIINCVSNSPSHALHQVLVNHIEPGGGAEDYSARIAQWRNVIDAVQAPPPRLANPRRTEDAIEFVVPSQRGRTNRVEVSPDLEEWSTLTNLFGTNAPVLVRDPVILPDTQRFYRVRRF